MEEIRVTLSGEIDLSNADEMRAQFEVALESHAERIIVDMEQVSFLGSHGIAELVRAKNGAGTRTIVLHQPSPMVLRTLEVCGLLELFPVEA